MRLKILFVILFFFFGAFLFGQKTELQTTYYTQELKQSEGKVDKNKKKTGQWKFWSAKGDLVMTAEYKNDTLNGVRLVEETNWNTGITVMFTEKTYAKALARQKNSLLDTVIDRIPFKMGKMHGTRKLYLENGKPLSEIDYINDKKHGEERIYNEETGKIMERIFYYEGKSDSAYFYDNSGVLTTKSYKIENGTLDKLYLNGKLASVTEERNTPKGKQTITCIWANGKQILCDTLLDKSFGTYVNMENVTDEQVISEKDDSIIKDEIFDFVEKEPQFPGGEKELYQYIQTHLSFDTTKVALPLKGRVFFQIVIRADGKVTDGKILRGLHPEVDRAVLEMIAKMPDWTPGELRGKKIATRYNLPVLVDLQ